MQGLTKGAPPGWARIASCWIAVVLLVFAGTTATASPTRSLRFEGIGIEQGLSQESVLNILQDRDGFMWFGTQAGLNRFDGYKVTVFRNDPANPGSLVDNYVLASFEDADGRLWFGTKGGLARYDAASGKFLRYPPDEPGAAAAGNRTVTAIVSDGRSGLWLGTGDGLKHFDPASGRFTSRRHNPLEPHSLRDDRVSALAIDGAGGLWVGTAAGLDRLAPAANSFEHFDLGPADDVKRNTVLSLSMGPRDTLWIGTARGLEAWRLGDGPPKRRHVGAAEGIGDVRIQSLYHDRGANLWVGTDLDGLKWRDPAAERFVSYRHEPLDRHSLPDNQVSSVWVDRTGTLWVGTLFGGVSRTDLASGGFARFTYAPGQAGGIGNNKVRAIAGDERGRLWIGTTGGGLTLLDPASGRSEHVRHDPAKRGSLPDDVVTAFAMAGGRLWVGTSTGLAWRDPADGSFHTVPLGQDATANFVQALKEDRGGTLWIVTRGGLFALGPDRRPLRSWRHDPHNPASLGGDHGFGVLEDSRGMLWIATDNGLDQFDRASGKFIHYRHDPADVGSLRHSRVYNLFESKTGQLWVGTAGGLHRMEHGAGGKLRFRFFPVTASPEAVPVGAVLEDANGTLWVSTTIGISHLDPATGQFKSYTAKDGLIDGSYFVGSAHRAQDGQFYFGGVNGMTGFAPDAIRDNPYPPAVQITGFLVSNRPRALAGAVQDARAVRLSHRDSVFSLEFAALHYADPQSNRYTYQLEGFDQGWVETDASRRFASYTNLDPGSYVFRVRASNKDGVWSEAPATLAITIEPPLWKSWWFRALAAALLLAAAVGGYRLRVRALVQQKQTLEREVGARTAELVQQNRQLKDTQARLVAHEKLASLGSLVAGVAHELNTPIGNSLLMASTLQEKTESMAASFGEASLRRSDLASYIAASQEASGLITRSLHNAAELVNSFKQVAVDQASAQQRRFDLAQACQEIAATMMNQVRLAGHTLELAVPDGIGMNSFPGPLGQVVINFVNNALRHAFDGAGGRMLLTASMIDAQQVRIEFRDDGAGIPAGNLARIFDPFFTTRMGQGGTGLGLNIAWNIVTSLLGGVIRVESTPGEGTTFILDLPLDPAQALQDIKPQQGTHA